MSSPSPDRHVEPLLRDLAPQVLGAVVRQFHDFAASEDAVQEALIAAAVQWPRDGVPDNPRSWLIRVAQRRLVDQLRSEASRRKLAAAVAEETRTAVAPADGELDINPNDTLVLLFMCCHPALTSASAIALTFARWASHDGRDREVVSGPGADHRSTHQPRKGDHQGIHHPVPGARRGRTGGTPQLGSAHAVPVFNEGYTSSGPDLQRPDLSSEAIRLVRELRRLLSANGDVAGLLALMLLVDARRAARSGPNSELIPLDEQDRSLWDRQKIDEGVVLASVALSLGR
jgi:predicted RNA polymerase sigma factor